MTIHRHYAEAADNFRHIGAGNRIIALEDSLDLFGDNDLGA